MPTLVSFHAHPDDEAINCAGTMAQAVADGHRVVLVVATGGELGEVPDGLLASGEQLAERRAAETLESARLIGVHRVVFLGYRDSGMIGTPGNDEPACFWQADLEDAAGRLAAILIDEAADVLTVYDQNGGYGHPDHVQVHRAGVRAAERAGTGRVYECTIDREIVRFLMKQAAELGIELPENDWQPEDFGSPSDAITTVVDVRAHLGLKRAAMAAHASQISETSFFLALPPQAFEVVWGQEWYIRRGAAPGLRETTLFDGLGR